MPLTLWATVGLPGCGKTTWAKAKRTEIRDAGGEVVLFSRDDFRAMMDGGFVGTELYERRVTAAINASVRAVLAWGVSVIIHDTNLPQKAQDHWEHLAGVQGAAFNLVDFRGIPLPTCIERDAARPDPVGEKVIRNMSRRYQVWPE